MTERLYYRDADLAEFEASLVRTEQVGDKFHSVLERTAFYPTSGGQLHDLGYLNEVPVVDVREEQEEIVHVTESQVGSKGDTLVGRIDQQRRWRHRQQHTAQHLLSSIFLRQIGAATVSVHLGEEYGAIEFDIDRANQEDLTQIEDLAFEAVRDDTPIEVLFVDAAEAEKYNLRRPPKREGTLRLVKIGDVECVACGGTHCNSTGQVGMIKLVGTDKLRGHLLVKFLAGSQALQDYRVRHEVTDTVSRNLTSGIKDLPDKIVDMVALEKELKVRISNLSRELIAHRVEKAAELAGSGVYFHNEELIEDRLLNKLATALADGLDRVTVVEASTRVIVAAPSGSSCDLRPFAKEFSTKAGLRGGGSPKLVQFGLSDSLTDQQRRILEETIAID